MLRPALLLAGCLLVAGAAVAKPPAYIAPEETVSLAPGPDVDIVDANCSACHSVDYITTQPRHFPDPKAFWSAEVTKMRTAYGFKTSDEDAAKIVNYLSETYR